MKVVIRFSVLASGSRGNACYVESSGARVLVDAGLSCRELEKRLALRGLSAGRLDAIILTHEHIDHIRGAGVMARRYSVPVYTTEGTMTAGAARIGKLPRMVNVRTGGSFAIADMEIEPFTKCHDAADPFALAISSDGVKLGIATDLGRCTRLVEDRLKGCGALVMEFNHDPDMLESGPYPLFLKRRISGSEGHLSNGEGARLTASLVHEGLDIVVCAHLSETNNDPRTVYGEAHRCLAGAGAGQIKLLVSDPNVPCPLVELHCRSKTSVQGNRQD